MTEPHTLDTVMAALPHLFPGPGGAAAVLRDGVVLERHAWGFANAERRIPFTPATLVRMCSVTKQFTCAAMLDLFPDPSVLDADVAGRLPLLEGAMPGVLHLAHNQSGLRDYWAVAMLHGSPVEAPFGDAEAQAVIGGTRTLQFAPGTRYSYVNQNFRLISDILEARTGRGFGELLRERVFGPAGMGSALLAADTRAMPDGTEGYEGTVAAGFRAAENRILWTGDAGLGASLDDMIAWEQFIDATRGDAESLYWRMTGPVSFGDGAAAGYGFGLGRRMERGRAVMGHGGALRGWRSQRVYVPGERVSVVVMFNHMADATGAASRLLAAAMGDEAVPEPGAAGRPTWLGAYMEPETGLSVRVEAGPPGRVRLRYGHGAELLDIQADGSAGAADGTRLVPERTGLRMMRPGENQSTVLVPEDAGTAGLDVVGRYRCVELNAVLTVVEAGGVLYGAFSGFLGLGRMEMLVAVAPDLWALPCPRALDHTPPGDWTLKFRREGSRVVRVVVGCWLARGLVYEREG